jgi:nucleoside-diphosphate-sugar epimerase
MIQKILVIGATGNVGSGLVKLLAEQGAQVKAATRTPEAYPTTSNVEAVAFDFDDVNKGKRRYLSASRRCQNQFYRYPRYFCYSGYVLTESTS